MGNKSSNIASRDSSKVSSKSELNKQSSSKGASSSIGEELLNEKHLLLKQLKAEVDTYQPRVNSLRATAEQLLLGLSSPLSSSPEPTSVCPIVPSSGKEQTNELSINSSSRASELKQDLYLLSNRIRSMQSKLDQAMEKLPAPAPGSGSRSRKKVEASTMF